MKEPRGYRNNNPGNIRKSTTKFVGEIYSEDAAFKRFGTMEHGVRAAGKILLTYYLHHQLKTPYDIIKRWAPPNENDTVAYAKAVAAHLGMDAHDTVNVTERATLPKLLTAIFRHENGRRPDGTDWVKADQIATGADWALGVRED